MEVMSHSMLRAGRRNTDKFLKSDYFKSVANILDVPIRNQSSSSRTEMQKLLFNNGNNNRPSYLMSLLKDVTLAFDQKTPLSESNIASQERY